jgi:hypothetical protein
LDGVRNAHMTIVYFRPRATVTMEPPPRTPIGYVYIDAKDLNISILKSFSATTTHFARIVIEHVRHPIPEPQHVV